MSTPVDTLHFADDYAILPNSESGLQIDSLHRISHFGLQTSTFNAEVMALVDLISYEQKLLQTVLSGADEQFRISGVLCVSPYKLSLIHI